MAAWSGDFAELDNEARQEPPQPLGEVVQHLMGKLEQDDRRVLRELVDSWAEIVGRDLAAATSPQRIDRQTLYIEVTNSSMRYKLNLKQRDLSRKLHDFTGGEVNRIRLVSGGRSATR